MNRTNSLEVKSHICGELQFKTEKTVCGQTVLGQMDTHTEENQFQPLPHSTHKKMNSDWITDISIKTKTINLEENIYNLRQAQTS